MADLSIMEGDGDSSYIYGEKGEAKNASLCWSSIYSQNQTLDPLSVTLSGEAVEPLRGGALLEDISLGQALKVYSFMLLLCSLCFMSVVGEGDPSAICSGCHTVPTTMDCPSGTISQNTPFLSKLLLVMVFYYNRKVTNLFPFRQVVFE